jgi:hypothetical protein
MDIAVWLTLAHILVFVYWLGGDLGAFVSASIITDAKSPPAARAAAAGLLKRIDLAPKTALILAAPTGLALAWTAGWAQIDPLWPALAFLIAAVWIVLAWRTHLKGKAAPLAGRADMTIRLVFLAALIVGAVAVFIGALAWPLFMALKLLALAGATALGLAVRVALTPFGPAFGRIVTGQGSDEDEEAVRDAISNVRVLVLGIWLMIALAAWLGVAKPV